MTDAMECGRQPLTPKYHHFVGEQQSQLSWDRTASTYINHTCVLSLLAHAGSTTLADLGLFGLLVVDTLVKNLGVVVLRVRH